MNEGMENLKQIAELEEKCMKDKTLIVKKKNVWGNERIYPVCNKAIIFSCIAASKTLCPITIANIKKLGYKFETQKEEI
jgi:hypothetical protein